MKESNRAGTSLMMLVLSMFIFGTIGIVRRSLTLPSEVIAFSRGVMGSAFLLILQRARGRRFAWGSIRKKDLLALAAAGAMIGFNWILLFEAYRFTTVAVATLCYYMQPVIVTVLSPLVLGERLTAKKVLCVLLALAGMILVSGVTGSGFEQGSHARGALLGLGAAALYACVVIVNKRISQVPATERTVIELAAAAIALLPYMLTQGSLHAYTLTPGQTIRLLTAGIVHTGIAYALYFGSIRQLSAQTCALLSYIDPVTAVILSALWLREPLTGAALAGTVLIIGAAAASEWQGGRARRFIQGG